MMIIMVNQGETKSAVATSYESGIKELSQEFRNRLQEEMTQVDHHHHHHDEDIDDDDNYEYDDYDEELSQIEDDHQKDNDKIFEKKNVENGQSSPS